MKQRTKNKKSASAQVTPTENEAGVASLSAREWGKQILAWPADIENSPMKAEIVKRMNAEHGAVAIGSDVKYTNTTLDQFGKPAITFWSAAAMREMYKSVIVERKGHRYRTLFDVWSTSPDRLEYTGVGYWPGSSRNRPAVPPGALNTWNETGVTPKKGDWNLFRHHLRNVICGGEQAHFDWLMDWLAHVVQCPQDKVPTSVVIRSSGKGIGKSKLGEYVSEIVGRQNASKIENKDQLFGRFNAALGGKTFVVLEEAVFAGSPADKNKLKEKISEKTTLIERKGIDPVLMPSYAHFMIFGNEHHVVPADLQERRYFMLDVSWDLPDPADKTAYFAPIIEQMEKDGGIAAMAHELLHRDYNRSALFIAPTTKHLARQQAFGLEPPERVLVEMARTEQLPTEIAGVERTIELSVVKPTVIQTKDLMRALQDECSGQSFHRQRTRLGELLKVLDVPKTRKRISSKRVEAYEFPTTDEFRNRLVEKLRVPAHMVEPAPEAEPDSSLPAIAKFPKSFGSRTVALDRDAL